MRPPLLRVLSLILGSILLASSAVLVVVDGPAGASGRRLEAEPAANLDNEVVRVSWSGFRPTFPDGTYGVLLYQCRANPTKLADCNQADPYPAAGEGNRLIGFTSDDGTGSTFFEVRPAAQLPELKCSERNPCSILAFENDPADPPSPTALPRSAVTAKIEFARSQADCPPVSDFDVRADGSSSTAPLVYQWAADVCQGRDAQIIDYTDTSSTTGRENFLSGLVDIGVTPAPPTDAELAAAPAHPKYRFAPLDLTAVAVVVNMVDLRTNRRIENLVLSPRLVARLVTNSDLSSFLSDPELRALNPGVIFPTVFSRPLLRAERDEDSRLVMQWATSTKDARDFLADKDRYAKRLNPAYLDYAKGYPHESFEVVDSSDDSYLPRTGQRNVALRMFYRVRPNGTMPETNQVGFLGVVDLPTAKRFALPTAKLLNAAGEAVGPTDRSLLAAYRAMKQTRAGTLTADLTNTDPDAYPLVKIDYGMVPTAPAARTAGQVARFLRHASGPGQENLPDGFVPLPDPLRAQTDAAAAALEQIATPPTTTTTAPTTTTTVADVPTTPYVPPYTPSDVDAGNGSSGFGDTTPTTSAPATDTSVSSTTSRPAATTTTVPTTTSSTIGPPPIPQEPSRLAIPVAFGMSGAGLIAWGLAGLGERRRARAAKGTTAEPRSARS